MRRIVYPKTRDEIPDPVSDDPTWETIEQCDNCCRILPRDLKNFASFYQEHGWDEDGVEYDDIPAICVDCYRKKVTVKSLGQDPSCWPSFEPDDPDREEEEDEEEEE